jgi:hypothetical protein
MPEGAPQTTTRIRTKRILLFTATLWLVIIVAGIAWLLKPPTPSESPGLLTSAVFLLTSSPEYVVLVYETPRGQKPGGCRDSISVKSIGTIAYYCDDKLKAIDAIPDTARARLNELRDRSPFYSIDNQTAPYRLMFRGERGGTPEQGNLAEVERFAFELLQMMRNRSG